ncbi:MAG: HDOD domain-containing protein [Planctomycetes bacterium]|nr:HDOD domain-containing protein [Planctomycetota bacterium]
MTNRALFVDDEPNVLDGIRRMLRPLRESWECEFAPGAREALSLLEVKLFDVVVTDMRMPGMDGAQLLAEICRRWPGVIRIVLSGQSEHEAVVRAVGTSHRYLAKPCDADSLRQTLEQALVLKSLIQNENVRKLVTSLRTVPTLPKVYEQLVAELQSPECSIQRIGSIVSADAGLVARLLQLVNSAYFGLPRRVTSAAQAANLLGLGLLRSLVLAGGVFGQFGADVMKQLNPERVWDRSTRVASLARLLGQHEQCGKDLCEDAFLAGMMQDIGQLVMAHSWPDAYHEVLALAKAGTPLNSAEREAFGADHAEVGAYLLGLWNLPAPVIEAVAFHIRYPATPMRLDVSTLVQAANLLVSAADNDPAANQAVALLAAGPDAERLARWQNLAKTTGAA